MMKNLLTEITLHLDVTAFDIVAGVRGDCYACPLSRALIRAAVEKFGESRVSRVSRVDGKICYFFLDGKERTSLHTNETSRFMLDFDGGRIVCPNEFTLKFT